jgi:hypothetical protein
MAIRSNHYDTAFEAYLRTRRTPYVAVDETKRTLTADASLKSMDFIVYATGGWNLLVDVKGRKFPSAAGPENTNGGGRGGHCWENWATEDDVTCLLRWQRVFGGGFRAALVFAYEILGEKWRTAHPEVWEFRDRTYAFYGVWVDDYAAVMTRRSRQWETVTVPAADYRRLRRPVEELLAGSAPPEAPSLPGASA